MVKKQKPIVWVISTDSTGEMRCRQGIAAKINPDFSVHDLQGKTPAAIKRHYIKSFGTSNLKSHANWPDFIISSGIKSTKAASEIKKLSGGKAFIIQNLKPKEDLHLFDLVAIPEHLLNEDLSGARNYIGTIGVPHFITEKDIEAARLEWTERFSDLSEPKIGVLLGGYVRGFVFTPELAAKMGAEINAKAKEIGASLVISNSRRTDLIESDVRNPDITNAFMSQITVPHFVHRWEPDSIENPYMGILACSDAIIVTGDSMSMCCEANISEKPVYIYPFDTPRKGFARLHEQLYHENLAKPFQTFLDKGIVPWEYEPLDTAGFIAEEAMSRWEKMRPTKQSNSKPFRKISDKIIAAKSRDMATNLFSSTIEGLQSVQESLNNDTDFQQAFFKTITLLRKSNHGRVLITGTGKSLRTGELVGASWSSLSVPCETIDPTHAVHGDLGKMVPEAGDILIVISKSGNLDENTERLLSKAIEYEYTIIAITHSGDSALSKTITELGDKGVLLKIPEAREPHPFLNDEGTKISPPTVSTTQVKVLLEAIGLALAKLRGMQVEHFQKNHPKGALGRKAGGERS